MSNLFDYSETPGSNQTVSGTNYFVEGQAANTVNDSMRQVMADVAAYLKLVGGNASTSGASNTWTLSTAVTLTTLATAVVVGFKAHAANTGAVTLNVDGLGAKKLIGLDGADLIANTVVQGGIYLAAYDATADSAAGAWILINATAGADKVIADINANATTTIDSDKLAPEVLVREGDVSLSVNSDPNGDRFFKAGTNRTGNGNSYIELKSNATYSYNARLIANAGVNGAVFLSSRGTGQLTIQTIDDANIVLSANGTELLRAHRDGYITCLAPIELASYSTAELNALPSSIAANSIVYCTDGDAGSQCLAIKRGSWRIIPIGLPISSS